LFHNIVGQIDGIRQFRIIQEEKDRLVVQLVTKEGFSNGNIQTECARNAIKSFLGEEMQVDVQFVQKIERDKTGKYRVFISHVS